MMILQVWQLPGHISPNQSRIWAFQPHQREEGVKSVTVGPKVARYDRSIEPAVVPCGRTTRRRPYQVNPNNFREESTIIFASSRRGAARRRATTAAKIHPSLDPSLPPSTIAIDSLYLIDLITVGSVVRQDYFAIESSYTMFMIVDLIMSE